MTANLDKADDPRARDRFELLSALKRAGIRYPPDRLEEAVVEYAQLKHLMAVVAAATRPSEPAPAAENAALPARCR